MALARIITRSHAGSRELALDLLARGYAVEIVSPDKIPENIADLELRIDTGLADRLTATVEAHDGERSASLEFVHYLKAPMVDFIRRPLESPDVVRLSEAPAGVVAGHWPPRARARPLAQPNPPKTQPRPPSIRLPPAASPITLDRHSAPPLP